jgi:serine/threonine protein phosphatase 1
MSLVLTLPPNTAGRDFVVGDIHGCFSLLRRLLDMVNFDEAADRLIAAGDLVDRGPESEQVLEWLAKPWFFAVRGNHEQMVIDAAAEALSSDMYLYNGGAWFIGLPSAEQQEFAVQLRELPLAIEIPTAQGLVGVVHVECPLNDWRVFCRQLRGELPISRRSHNNLQAAAMWSRKRISAGSHEVVEGALAVVVGHTPHNLVVQFGNTIYLDTGACFGGLLSAVCLNDWGLHQAKGERQ